MARQRAKLNTPESAELDSVPAEAPQSDAPILPGSEQSLRQPLDPDQVRVVGVRDPNRVLKVRRREWLYEIAWLQCLIYPFFLWPVILSLAAALTGLTAGAVLWLPQVLAGTVDPKEMPPTNIPIVLVPLFILGYTCGYLDTVLSAAAAGTLEIIRRPHVNLLLPLKSAATWLFCFLAGPVIPAGISFLYWYFGGNLTYLDWLILAELVTVTVGYWLLAVVAVSQRDHLFDANPARIARLIQRLGVRVLVVAFFASLLTAAQGVLTLLAIESLHRAGPVGLALIAGCWISGLYWATVLFRLLGIWCYQTRGSA
jgi:hypothetical protein